MRVYTAEEEHRIRLQAHVRAWTHAGLIDATRASTIDNAIRTDLKRTTSLLRAALAAFTALIAAAAIGLMFVTFEIRGEIASATVLTLAAILCFAAADYLTRVGRLYRYGVEEALAALSPVLVAIAAVVFAHAGGRHAGNVDTIAGLLIAGAAAFVVYQRFGFVYAGVGSIACIGLVPTQFNLPPTSERIMVAALFGAIFFVARAAYRSRDDEFPGDEFNVFEAAACVGAYLSLNLHAWNAAGGWLWSASTVSLDRWFYWATYAATWLIPAAVLADAIRAKDRPLLAVGIAEALATLATNKLYLGIARQTWDPMLLGVVLAGTALAVRRWLATGPGGARRGYTSERILQGDRALLEMAANASVAWHGRVHAPPPAETSSSAFGGGRSGGGGGGATY